MKIQEILINDIDIIENHRVQIQDSTIAQLMQSIKQHGLEQPIGVSLNKKNKYDLVFGNRRLLACQKLGWSKITASVYEGMELKQLLILNVTENIQRVNPSFAEIGRAIEKLNKLGLTLEEISVRLGMPKKKIDEILFTYTKLDVKHRSRVQFTGKGGRKNENALPAQTALAIVKMKKSYGLSDKNVDNLIKCCSNQVEDTQINKEMLKNLALLLRNGLPYEEAMEKLDDYFVYRIDLCANKLEIGKLVEQHQIGSHQILFKKILYGQLPGIKKPGFIKI